MNPCGLEHDPEPWLTSSMAASCQAMWSSPPKFRPRAGYCQDLACYDQVKAQKAVSS